MKMIKILIVAVALSTALVANAQQKIEFRDGTSLTVLGNKIGVFTELDADDGNSPRKETEIYVVESETEVTISLITRWLIASNKGNLDEVRIYTVVKSQVLNEPFVNERTDDNDVVLFYVLGASAIEEQNFNYADYSYLSNVPTKKSFNIIRISCDEKEPLEKLAALLYKVVNEEVEEETQEATEE
jgi:hypothetical protein